MNSERETISNSDRAFRSRWKTLFKHRFAAKYYSTREILFVYTDGMDGIVASLLNKHFCVFVNFHSANSNW